MIGSLWQSFPYRLRRAFASLSGITFMFVKLLSLDDKCVAALFPDEHYANDLLFGVDVEQHAILTLQTQLAFGDWIRPQRFHVARLCQRIIFQKISRQVQDGTTGLSAEPDRKS